MKPLLLRLLLLAPLGLLLVGVNYRVDPAHLFSGGTYERGVAALLARGQNVTGLTNFDERLLQKCALQALPKRPPVLVLGSSRVMLIGAPLYPAGTLHNGGVSGGVLEDMLAVYGLYTARGWHPDTLLIGIDPWMFNANHGQLRWRTLAPEALAMRRQLGATEATEGELLSNLMPPGSTAAKLSELVSLTYFKESLKTWRVGANGPTAYQATASPVNDGFPKHPDNSIAYARAFREQNAEADAREYIALKPVYSLGNFTELAPDTRNTLGRLVAHARQHGAVVRLLLTPYHPLVWDFLRRQPEYQQAPRAEAWCRTFAAEQGIQVLGSFDPTPFGLTNADFYDGMHCKPTVITQLLRPAASR